MRSSPTRPPFLYRAQSSLPGNVPCPPSLHCFYFTLFALPPSCSYVRREESPPLTEYERTSPTSLYARTNSSRESPTVGPSPFRFLPPSLIHDPGSMTQEIPRCPLPQATTAYSSINGTLVAINRHTLSRSDSGTRASAEIAGFTSPSQANSLWALVQNGNHFDFQEPTMLHHAQLQK